MEIYDLAAVMPVYNEKDCIVDVVQSWFFTLTSLGINFRIIVLNDGSNDGTKDILNIFSDENRVEVINKQNSGHGPTIILGYKKAVKIARWTFQCDSDDEIKPDYFNSLWKSRFEYDALFGVRRDRKQGLSRSLISFISRLCVRFMFGSGITDVNTPYRLIRSALLKRMVDRIPSNCFAPNVIISGLLCKFNFRIYEQPVPHENRKTGKVSIVRWKLIRAAMKSFMQTLVCSIKIKGLVE